MKTVMQPRSYNAPTPHASTPTRRLARPFAAFGRWLALALVAGFSLAAQAQTTATATATIVNGFVVVYTVTDGGSGYIEPPVVTVLGGGGTGATAVAVVANGMVTQINPVSPGNGYTSPPQLVISAPAQTTATATATVSYGFVVAYMVTAGGSGYTEPPLVTVLGGGGTGATATALVTNGVVTQINPVSPGSGYTSPPEVVISAPVVEPTVLALQMIPLVTIHGFPGDTNQIEATTSLEGVVVWKPVATVVLTNAVQEWYDRVSLPWAWRFYRAVLVGAGSRPTPGLRFVWLPAGQFMMGSPTNEVDHQANEGPQTRVTLTRGFFLGRYEVTQGEYLSVIGTNPSIYTGDTNRPVETVLWDDATNYCAQLTARELVTGRLPAGWAYRLPTEAEWEYASRAGSTNRFSYGDDPGYAQLGNYAWYNANSGGMPHAVGGKLPNRWGLYDMSGNVWEWCADWLGMGNYPGGSVTDPLGSGSGSIRVGRGGCWHDSGGRDCRSAYRRYDYPSDRYANIGFRVVLAPAQP